MYMSNSNCDNPLSIDVETEYLGKQQEPKDKSVFVFSYTVNITNNSEEALQLIDRHWFITNGDGEKVEVQGKGVVGEQPVIQPNQTYSYTSASMLKTEVGTMHGYYSFKKSDSTQIKANIPIFRLATPNSLH